MSCEILVILGQFGSTRIEHLAHAVSATTDVVIKPDKHGSTHGDIPQGRLAAVQHKQTKLDRAGRIRTAKPLAARPLDFGPGGSLRYRGGRRGLALLRAGIYDWVHVVALDAAENVLLVRQYRHALGRISLELPGGNVDAQDESPLATAARELLEETGFGNAARLTLVGSHSPNPASHANRMHTVLAEDVALIQPPLSDDIEVLEVERVPVARLCAWP